MIETFKIILRLIGASLLFLSICCCLNNFEEGNRAKINSEKILSLIEAEMCLKKKPDPENGLMNNNQENMICDEVDGVNVIGILSIPSIDRSLPVISDLSQENLKISPCVYNGSYLSNDIIIAGHNYKSHFGGLSKLNPGDKVIFESANEKTYYYTVEKSEIIKGSDIQTMMQGNWDMTLFTCMWYRTDRLSVRLKLEKIAE